MRRAEVAAETHRTDVASPQVRGPHARGPHRVEPWKEQDPASVKLADLLEAYRPQLERRGGPKHVKTVRNALKRAFAHMRARTVADVTVEKADAYLDQVVAGGDSAGTANHHRGYLRALFNWAELHDHIARSPLRALARRDGPIARRRQANSPEEVVAILEAAAAGKPYEYDCYYLAYSIGLRQNEVLRLRWGDIDWREGTYHLIDTRQKGKRDTVTPLQPAVLSYLRDLKSRRELELDRAVQPDETIVTGVPTTPRAISADRHATIARAGLEYRSAVDGAVCDWHSMRHSFLSNLDCDIRIKMDLARHRNITTTMRYDHTRIDRERAALARMPRVEGCGRVGRAWKGLTRWLRS